MKPIIKNKANIKQRCPGRKDASLSQKECELIKYRPMLVASRRKVEGTIKEVVHLNGKTVTNSATIGQKW